MLKRLCNGIARRLLRFGSGGRDPKIIFDDPAYLPIQDAVARREWVPGGAGETRPDKYLADIPLEEYPPHFRDLLNIVRRIGICGSVLVVGCGVGVSKKMFDAAGLSLNYVGIDITPELIQLANMHFGPSSRFHVMNGERLMFEENSFEAVIIEGTLQHADNYAAMVREAARVARDRLIIHRATIVHDTPTKHYERRLGDGRFVGETHINEEELFSILRSAGLAVDAIGFHKKRHVAGEVYVYFKTYTARKGHDGQNAKP